jgi:hypothetical protein
MFLEEVERLAGQLFAAVRGEREQPTRDALSVIDAIGDLSEARERWLHIIDWFA